MPALSRSDRGATAVEVALVIPLVLALVGVIILVGWGMGIRAMLNRGVEAGARAGAVVLQIGATGTDRYRSDADIEEAVCAAAILLDCDRITFDPPVSWPPQEGAEFTVSATYTWDNPVAAFVAPVVGGAAATEGMTFRAQAVRIRE